MNRKKAEDSIMRLDNVEIANEILKDNDNEEREIPISVAFSVCWNKLW